MAETRDRKAYQADYYRRNKNRLNARRTAARREKRGEANGVKEAVTSIARRNGKSFLIALSCWRTYAGRCAGQIGRPP